jgi:hypothetical protein
MRKAIEVEVLATTEATVVEVRGGTYFESDSSFVGQGYAKKHPNDDNDCETGHALAMARALRQLADAYESRAQDRIDHPIHYRHAMGGVIPQTGLKKLAQNHDIFLWGGLKDSSPS